MPRANAKSSRSNRDLGKLYKVLTDAFPRLKNNDGALDVYELANKCGLSHMTLYASFQREGLSVDTAKKIIAMSGGRLNRDKLALFLPSV